jgi:hypothetical protein
MTPLFLVMVATIATIATVTALGREAQAQDEIPKPTPEQLAQEEQMTPEPTQAQLDMNQFFENYNKMRDYYDNQTDFQKWGSDIAIERIELFQDCGFTKSPLQPLKVIDCYNNNITTALSPEAAAGAGAGK